MGEKFTTLRKITSSSLKKFIIDLKFTMLNKFSLLHTHTYIYVYIEVPLYIQVQ